MPPARPSPAGIEACEKPSRLPTARSAVVWLVGLAGPVASVGTAGAVVSTVHSATAGCAALPAPSDADTVRECGPSATPVSWYGLVQATLAAESSLHPYVVAPVALKVKLAVELASGLTGPVSSTSTGAVRSTTQDTEDESPRTPKESRDLTTTVWLPSATVPVAHGLVQVTGAAPSRAQV